MANLTLAQMLALLPDNTTGLIDAADLRDIVTAIFERTDGTTAIPALLFDTNAVQPVHVAGHIHWNTDVNIMEMDVSATGSLQVGHEQWIDGRNTTGATILDGRPVRITTGGGQDAFIALDNGLGTCVGLTTENIANNSTGRVTSFGLVHDLNTSAFVDGARLYATATGTLSTTISSSFVGTVLAAHATQGVVFVSPEIVHHGSGTTAQRPTPVATSFNYFDTTLGIPVFWNGTVWKNASGATV